MTARPTPFALAFDALAADWFPGIADGLARGGVSAADRDAFVLLQPVGALLRELVPEDAAPEAVEAYARLLHHAYRHWAAGGWVYRVSDALLDRATAGGPLATRLGHPALYLQLPPRRVWRTPDPGGAPEPLDGMFVTETTAPGSVAVLGISGMHRHRPGFSAVAVEGRADSDDASAGELLVESARPDGSAAFAPLLEGGPAAHLYSLASAGELLLLTARLLALLPPHPRSGEGGSGKGEGFGPVERVVDVP